MTGCMLVGPSDNVNGLTRESPLILSDVIATKIGKKDGIPILPTTVNYDNRDNNSTVILKRKSYIINDRAAIAFSGDGRIIEECLEECAAQMPAWLLTERPMQRLTNFVNEYRGVKIVGAAIDPDTGRMNTIYPNEDLRKLRHLGNCAAIGSGSKELWDCARRFENDLDKIPRIPAASRAHGFSWQVNTYSLSAEIDGRVNDWGGYIEEMHVAPVV